MVRHRVRRRARRTAWLLAIVAVVAVGCTTGESDPADPATDATATATATPTEAAEQPTERVATDAVTWKRLAVDSSQLTRSKRDEVIDLIAGDGVLVAAGRRNAEAGAWISEDGGRTWSAARGLPGSRTGSVDVGVVADDGSIVLAGAEVEGDSIASAWTNDGGLQFDSVPFVGDVPAAYPFGMVETDSGFVLLDNAIRVWRSDDGSSWMPVEGTDGTPLVLAPLHIPTGPVVRDDGSLVALAVREGAELLESDDDGNTWIQKTLDAPALAGAYLRTLVEMPDGALIAGGFVLGAGDAGEDALVVRSDDGGVSWDAVDLGDDSGGPGPQAVTGLATMGDVLVAVGAASAEGQRWPGAWASTDDGRTWSAIHPPANLARRGSVAGTRGERFQDLVVVDDHFVVVGNRDAGGDVDVSVWRLSVTP